MRNALMEQQQENVQPVYVENRSRHRSRRRWRAAWGLPGVSTEAGGTTSRGFGRWRCRQLRLHPGLLHLIGRAAS